MSDRVGQSNHVTAAQAVYATVTDVLDTVASFDGRFSFTPVNPAGHGVLSFATRDERLDLAVDVTFDAQVDHVRVTLTHAYVVPTATSIIAYEGLPSATAIHYQLGAALAKWYGEAVRSQFGPTVGENEG